MQFGGKWTVRGASAAAVFLCLATGASVATGQTPLERGTYLMQSIVNCGNCHTPQNQDGLIPGMELAGGLPIEEPGVFMVFTPNITPDEGTGIGTWSDEDIARAIRECLRPDGAIIGPPMPCQVYRGLSDNDVDAIIAYLRQVPAVENEVQPSEYHVPLPPAYGPPIDSVADVDPADQLAYGEYLAGPLGHCTECHSSPGPMGAPDLENALNQGGFPFHGPWGVSVSPPITGAALERYSDEELVQIITTGVRPDGSQLLPPMGTYAYANMTDEDMAALIAYLRSL